MENVVEQKKKGVGSLHFLLFLCLKLNSDANSEPFPKRQVYDSSKLKKFVDNNLKFDTIGKKFSNREENTVGKGEIAYYEQFLFFP